MTTSEPAADALIRQIHGSGYPLALALTGGGSRAVGQLLEIPGGSRSLLEAVVPYSPAALDAFLGGPPEQYCSEPTARLMAMAALRRGQGYLRSVATPGEESPRSATSDVKLAGVGVTASLASDRPKRGSHRAYVAVQTRSWTASVSLELTKGARSRQAEESLVATMLLNAAAEACELADRLPLNLLAGESPIQERTDAPAAWQALLFGTQRAHCQSGEPAPPHVIFPGSFRPRHAGHRQMALVAAEQLGQPVAYELSVANVDKPLLDYREIELRCGGFAADETLWLTQAPTFLEKAELFPGATFVVGADTIRRIADPKYYAGDVAARDDAVRRLAARGTRFLVFGRIDDGRFQLLDDLALPPALRAMCRGVGAEHFRHDVSSTQVRQAP